MSVPPSNDYLASSPFSQFFSKIRHLDVVDDDMSWGPHLPRKRGTGYEDIFVLHSSDKESTDFCSPRAS